MHAITVRDRNAGIDGLSLMELPYPHAGQNDVNVRVHAGVHPRVSCTGRQRGLIAPGDEVTLW
jgi:hypothetical protein